MQERIVTKLQLNSYSTKGSTATLHHSMSAFHHILLPSTNKFVKLRAHFIRIIRKTKTYAKVVANRNFIGSVVHSARIPILTNKNESVGNRIG